MKIKNSLINRRFHKLLVIAPAEPDKNGIKRWLCRCDCGNEKTIYQQSLCRGSTKSCGCYNEEVSRKRMSQGWDKVFTKEFLSTEHIEKKKSLREIAKEAGCSAGCIARYMKKHNLQANDAFHDIAGKKFEMLTVTDMAYTRKGNSYWNVTCECGNTKIVQGRSLVRYNIVSCGCWNRNKNWKGCGDLSKTYWSRIISRAVKRKIPFEINMQYAWDLFEKQKRLCAISGVEIVMERQYSEKHHKNCQTQTASLDRIDSSLGYSEGNVQWVHLVVNRMKSDLPQDEFLNWCKLICTSN